MRQSFKIEVDTEGGADLLRADLQIRSSDGRTTVQISTPVDAELLRQPLDKARADVLRSVIAMLQEQSQTP